MLMIKLYKINNELAPLIMDSMLNRRNYLEFQKLANVPVRKKDNYILWSKNFKLPFTPTMVTCVRRN